MNNEQIKKILNRFPDKQRQDVENILYGKIVKQVKCLSKKCKGRIIAYIYSNGKIREIGDEKGLIYLRASRRRLDGELGFQCWCGNDSRLCEAEKGNKGIENNAVQKSDLHEVFAKLEKNPKQYPPINGKQEVDKFLIEDI